MATTNQAVQSNTVQSGYNQAFNSLYDAMLKPQVFGELIELYGKGLGIFDMLYFAGNTIDVKGHKQTVWSQGAIQKPITIGSNDIEVGAAGADIAFTLDASEFDTNDKTFLSIGDAIFIPEEYLAAGTTNGPAKYQITDISAAGAAGVYTAKPFLSTYDIDTAVPAGTKLMVTGGNYAPGSQGASAKSRGWYSEDYHTAIKRAAYHLEGSNQSDERWQDKMKNGEMGMFSKASAEADFLLTAYMNDELFLGEEPNNITMLNREGDSNDVRGTKGLWRHLVSDGGFQEYINNYDISDFDDVKDMFRSQGVINQAALFAVGSGLNRQLENSGLDFLKEFSGGTDLMQNLDQVGVQFRKIKKNSILYAIVELASFDNPQTYGLSAYDWKNRGFIVPNEFGAVKMGDSTESITLSNLTLGNKNYNGENRTRVSGTLGGVNGMGYRFVDTWDDVRGELLAEFMLIATKRNQMIRVEQA